MDEEQILEGEVMEKKPVTLRTVRFAQRVAKGIDPVTAVKQITKVGQNKPPGEQLPAQKKEAVRLLKECQDQMLLDLTGMAPKGMAKLEELLEAKDPVYFQGREVGEKPNHSAQFQAAKMLVEMAEPDKGQKGTSLVGLVLNFNNDNRE